MQNERAAVRGAAHCLQSSTRAHDRRFDAVDARYSSGAYRVDERVGPALIRRGSDALDQDATGLEETAHLLDDEVLATCSGRELFGREQRGVPGMDEDFTRDDFGACPRRRWLRRTGTKREDGEEPPAHLPSMEQEPWLWPELSAGQVRSAAGKSDCPPDASCR